jgi:gliding motility-associated-like protein
LINRILYRLLIGVVSFGLPYSLIAQNDCEGAINLNDVYEYCSENGAFTNVNATQSTQQKPVCWQNSNNDVWFKFIAIDSDLRIMVLGNIDESGTLRSPELALYNGDCDSGLNLLACAVSPSSSGYVSLFQPGLLIGETYYIRVDGRRDNTGTFKLCVNNYAALPQPGQDCKDATLLCNDEKVSFNFLPGGGSNPTEANLSCLLFETNTVWLKFVCSRAGSFTFTITPTNPSDDIDFVLYALPLGINNCNFTLPLRCNAAGLFYPGPCNGPTGLRTGDTDNFVGWGCNPGDDAWSAPINLVRGQAYALLVDNFSSGNDGFYLEFGGTASIKAVTSDFSVNTVSLCNAARMTFTDRSINAGRWNWNFGSGASIVSANTRGPHNVVFQPGTHTVTLRATNLATGCVDIKDTTFTIPVSGLDFITTANNPACGLSNGKIAVNISSGTPPYKVSLNGGPIITLPATDSFYVFSNLSSGAYPVKVEDSNGCSIQKITSLVAADQLTLFPVFTTDEDCTGGNGTITVAVSSGVPPYFYSLNTGQEIYSTDTFFTFKGLNSGSYTLIVGDNSDCTRQELVVGVNNSDDLDIDISLDDLICSYDQGAIIIDVRRGAAPVEFSLDQGNTYSTILSSPYLLNVLSGIYDLLVRDANGCVYSTSVSLGLQEFISVRSVDISGENCAPFSGSISVTASGGLLPYRWILNGEVVAQTNDSQYTFEQLSSGNYIITIEDSLGCSELVTGMIEGNPGISDLIIVALPQECGNAEGLIRVQFNASSPPYKISLDNGNSFPYTGIAETDYAITGLSDGTFDVVVEDNNGCRISQQVVLNSVPYITRVSSVINNELCGLSNGSIALSVFDGSTPFSFRLNTDPIISEELGNYTFAGLSAGDYTVTVSDASGCPPYVRDITIQFEDNFNIQSLAVDNAWCFLDNGRINLVLSSELEPYVYSVNRGEDQVTNSSVILLTDLPPGAYLLSITAENGCKEDTLVSVGRVDAISSLILSVTNESCSESNGSIQADVIGGSPPYRFFINGELYSVQDVPPYLFEGLSAGAYQLDVTDQFNCFESGIALISDKPGLRITEVLRTDATCEIANGSLQAIVLNPNTSADYTWKDAYGNILGTQSTLNSIAAGIYVFKASDNIGCIDSQFVELLTTPLPVFEAIRDTLIIESQSVLLQLIGDTDGAVFWTPDITLSCSDCISSIASPDSTTVYVVSLTNQYGCVSYDTVTVSVKYLADAYVPSGFSPNGDGVNDILHVNGINLKIVSLFQVFNRWGEKVFERRNFPANDPGYGWDGVYKGIQQAVDVYIYYLEVLTKKDELKSYKGAVSLLR